MIAAIEPVLATGVATPRGDIAVAEIHALNHDGRGVGRVDGKITFIEGALPGEQVRFRYHNKRPQYDAGVVVEVLRPSADRVAPPCPYFGVCGGCVLQHMAPTAQLAAKQQVLADNFTHIGRVQPETWLPPIAGAAWGYRRRARLGVRLVPKKGGVIIGFRERRRSFITQLDACLTLDPRASRLLPALHELITGLSRPNRLPQIEVAVGDDVCAFVFRHLEPLTDADRERFEHFGAEHGVQIFLQPKDIDSVRALFPPDPVPLTYRLQKHDVCIEFRPTDFIQVNAEVNRALVHQAIALLDVQAHERVLDLFCGLGNFTLPLARRAAAVVGMEADAGLLARAGANAVRNDCVNVEFRHADLYKAPPALDAFDKLLLDPPRTGAMEALRRLPHPGPQRIVYVACDPATLARDSDYLVHARGYRLRAAGVADMFPQTSHVESIALFERE